MSQKSEPKPNIFAELLKRKNEAKKKSVLGSELAKNFGPAAKPQAFIPYGGRNGNGKP